jgi:hypothetical protein
MGDRRSEWPSPRPGSTCAKRVRRKYLDQLRRRDDLQVELLHEIAREFIDQCGYSAFKAHRIACGWTVAEAVEAFREMCRREKLKPRGLVAPVADEQRVHPTFDSTDLPVSIRTPLIWHTQRETKEEWRC